MDGKFATEGRRLSIVGYKQLQDTETGELIDCQVATVEDKDLNFQKFWLGNILAAVDELSNKRMKVIFYLFQLSLQYRSQIIPKTTADLAKELNFSPTTVQETLKILASHNIIRRKTGNIFLNPDVIFKGRRTGRQAVLIEYRQWEQQELPLDNPNTEEDFEDMPRLAQAAE